MALQVWLPLNGNLNNQGLCNCGFSTFTTTVNNSGKIGKCYNFTQNTGNGIYLSSGISCADFMSKYINNHSWTLCGWVKTSSTSSTPFISLTYGLRFFVGASTSISLYNSSRVVSCSANIATNGGVWHHVAASYNVSNNVISIYVDGVLKNTANYTSGYTYSSSWTNGIFIGRDPNNNTQNDSYFYKGDINDVRIYDHCLSPKEVKEISKGLILHYKLDDRYSEGITNLTGSAKYWESGSSVWGAHTSNTTNITYGDNDPIPVKEGSKIELTYSTTTGSGGGVGRHCTSVTVKPNTTYTYSIYIKTSDNFTYTHPNFLYRYEYNNSTYITEQGIFNLSRTIDLGNGWKRAWGIFTTNASTNKVNLYFFSYPGKNVTYYLSGMQLEEKDHATPYVNGTRTATTIYDSSGYQNHGTITGALTINNDTPRYNYSTLFGGQRLVSTTASGQYILTISLWAKDNGSIPSDGLMFKDHLGDMALGIQSNILYSGKSGGQGAGSINISNINYTVNTWHHWVMVNRNNTYYVYMNGQQVLSGTSGCWSAGTITNALHIGGRSGSSAWPGSLSDFRAYATALSEDDIKELYHNAGSIDNQGDILGFEFDEEEIDKGQILKTGIIKINDFIEVNDCIYLPAGTWIDTGLNYNNSDTCKAETIIKYESGGTGRDLMGYSGSGAGYWGVTASGSWEPHGTFTYTNSDITKKNTIVYIFSSSSEHGTYRVGALGSSYSVRGKYIYRVRLYKNNILERDLYPIQIGNKVGLFDLLHNEYYLANNTNGILKNDDIIEASIFKNKIESNQFIEK